MTLKNDADTNTAMIMFSELFTKRKSLTIPEFKEFADDLNKLKLALGMVDNILGKGENTDSQHFLLFPQCF